MTSENAVVEEWNYPASPDEEASLGDAPDFGVLILESMIQATNRSCASELRSIAACAASRPSGGGLNRALMKRLRESEKENRGCERDARQTRMHAKTRRKALGKMTRGHCVDASRLQSSEPGNGPFQTSHGEVSRRTGLSPLRRKIARRNHVQAGCLAG